MFDKIANRTSDRTSKYPQQIRSIALFNQNNPHHSPGQLSNLNKYSDRHRSEQPTD
ncbi:hypothetical protein QT971_17240 [Microcoleus sp. herbarium19]|uniref:hypothetical protein n=1 Tax=unclassified Microcoleus TaxID=2642155 RepID=UPI002FD49A89